MAKGKLPWRSDSAILERLVEVERRHLRRQSGRQIAAALDVDEGTIRNDLKRIRELWGERVGSRLADMKAEVIAELDDTARIALEDHDWDREMEYAVLAGATVVLPDGRQLRVHYDDDGRAQFRGGKSQALNVRRQAVMDKAKVLGLIVDKQEPTGEQLVRIYVRDDREPDAGAS